MSQSKSQQIHKLLLELMRVRSSTATRQEKDVEAFLHNWLTDKEYFKNHPDQFGLYPLPDDPLERAVVWGLVKGRGNQTVVLIHHHDAVDTFDYGNLGDVACEPAKLQSALQGMDLTSDVRADLESGNWIFGRGSSDMKGGAAIQCVLLEEYSRKSDFGGNLLLLSLPDEENISKGMLSAVGLLTQLKDQHNLDYRMVINSEPHHRGQDKCGLITLGSAGKLLAAVYVRGRKTHIGYIYGGLNPVLLLSEIVRQTELNADYCDVAHGDVSPPPSWSYMRDTKEVYDASIPASAGGYLSLISLKRTPADLLSQLKATCELAVELVKEKISKSHEDYTRKLGCEDPHPTWNIQVRTFSELYQQALTDAGRTFEQAYARKLESVASAIRQQQVNSPEATLKIMEMTLSHVADLSPTVVIALSPPFYPSIHNEEFECLPERARNLPDHLISTAEKQWHEAYKEKGYTMGMSDSSYVALQRGEGVVPVIGPNMPLWGKTYVVPFPEMESLNIPVVDIGPWGKDAHKFTERVYKTDLLERTPVLLQEAIDYLLGKD